MLRRFIENHAGHCGQSVLFAVIVAEVEFNFCSIAAGDVGYFAQIPEWCFCRENMATAMFSAKTQQAAEFTL